MRLLPIVVWVSTSEVSRGSVVMPMELLRLDLFLSATTLLCFRRSWWAVFVGTASCTGDCDRSLLWAAVEISWGVSWCLPSCGVSEC